MAVWAAVLSALAALYGFAVWPRLFRRDADMLRGRDFAHRGLWGGDVPENSVRAFRQAADAGFGVELDVRLTLDGRLVVFHDDTLTRLCGRCDRVDSLTLAQLEAVALPGGKDRIPSLDAALSALHRDTPLIVEIKPEKRLRELCAKTRARLARHPGPYCVESFHPLAVRWFRRHAPEVIRGQLTFGIKGRNGHRNRNFLVASLAGNFLGRPDFIACEAATDARPPMALMRAIRPWLAAWTVRSQSEMDALRKRYDAQIFEGFVPKR